MKQDIMDTAKTTPKKETVMFEVSDKGREHEFGISRRSWGDSGGYIKLFKSFLESLGLNCTETYTGSTTITIDGVEFGIDTTNASYISKNAFTRDTGIRKPENRFIKFAGMRIHFNKELDAGKIKKKVSDIINASKNWDETQRQHKQRQIDNTKIVGRHFSEKLKQFISSIYMSQGEIVLHMKDDIADINLNSDGTFKETSYKPKPIKSIDDLRRFLTATPTDIKTITDCLLEISKLPKLPAELTDWVGATYHNYYDVKKDNVK